MNYIKNIVVIFLLLLMTSRIGAEEEMTRFTFLEVTPSEQPSSYFIKIQREETKAKGGYIAYQAAASDIETIQKYLKLASPLELTGKSFEAPAQSSEINWFATQIRHDFKYKTPANEELYDLAAQALAQMNAPDFSEYLGHDVAKAFAVPFEDGFSVNRKSKWLNNFKGRLSQYSQGDLTLEDSTPEIFKRRVKGPADYFILKSSKSKQSKKLIFGPYKQPFSFE